MVTADVCLISGLDGYGMDQGCQFVRFCMGRTNKVMKRRLPGVKFGGLQGWLVFGVRDAVVVVSCGDG